MKHAYLIIAHNEFEVLQSLPQAIDDKRNDVYIHFDKKVKKLPALSMLYSRLHILKRRVDVRWGNISQIKAEFALFEYAYAHGEYQYYHLLSGVHLPLQSQDVIHAFFDTVYNKEVLMPMPTSEGEIALKIRKYNLFTNGFASSSSLSKWFSQKSWNLLIYMQRLFHIRRHSAFSYMKASNWVSVTGNCVAFLLSKKKNIFNKYRYTLCGDEFFIPSELGNSNYKFNVLYYDKLLKCNFKGVNPCIYTSLDYDELIHSQCLFARKFSNKDLVIVNRIVRHVTTDK